MPKLIIDDHAIKIAVERLAGQPIFAEPDGTLLKPGVIDLAEVDSLANPWLPANDRARGIVLGAEACKEIVFQAERMKEQHRRGRILKALCVPVCSLMDVLQNLMQIFNQPSWRTLREDWPPYDQEAYTVIGRRIRKTHTTGPVRKARNRIGAHLDLEAAHGGIRVAAEDVLGALADSLIVLMLMLHHPHAFSWIRPVGTIENEGGLLVDTMDEYPLCLRWLTDMDGHVLDVGNVRLAENPLREIHTHIVAANEAYNMMVRETNCPLRLMSQVDTNELRENPRIADSLTLDLRAPKPEKG